MKNLLIWYEMQHAFRVRIMTALFLLVQGYKQSFHNIITIHRRKLGKGQIDIIFTRKSELQHN